MLFDSSAVHSTTAMTLIRCHTVSDPVILITQILLRLLANLDLGYVAKMVDK
jgi:hypothetical protein